MDLPFGGDPEQFADAPLFRELQRVMASSSGPVNWELARQIGIASAQEGREDHAPSEADRHAFEEAVRVAELHVASFTGLEPPNDVAEVKPVRRAEWVNANTESLKTLLEPAAQKITAAMGEASRASMGELPPEMQAMSGIFEDVSGYSGSLDWTRFFSVIYQTEAFVSEDRVRSEMARAGTLFTWKTVLVTGAGGRPRKKRAKSP